MKNCITLKGDSRTVFASTQGRDHTGPKYGCTVIRGGKKQHRITEIVQPSKPFEKMGHDSQKAISRMS